MSKKPLEIDMVAGSQLRDTQGETLSIEGCDISALENGTAKFSDNHGKGFFNHIGRITSGKKIFKAEDCENERHRYYWEQIKAPYIYAKGYLFNDEDHPNARAAAAVVRNIHRSDCALKMKASVEGGVISRGLADPTFLAKTKLGGVALTLTPANQATLVEPLNLDKSACDHEADMILIKSVLHLAETNIPSFRHITRDASAEKIENNINKIIAALGTKAAVGLKKALIEDSLENKIADNVVMIHDLVKGAMRQRASFNPNDIDLEQRKRAQGWVSNDDPQGDYASHTPPDRMEGAMRERALHKLHGRTQTRRNPKTQEREFLLHRGINSDELNGGTINENKEYTHRNPLHSWSWNQATADGFGRDGGATLSAWIPESQIHHMPSMVGEVSDNPSKLFSHKNKEDVPKVGKPTSLYSEKEVIVSGSKPIKTHEIRTPTLRKGLTAGYGGAGAPTSMSGGGVLQAESQELGPKHLSFITCDHCGKEQVYGKYQVKCREPNCGKAFSMAKLEKFFSLRKSRKNSPEEQAKLDDYMNRKAKGLSPPAPVGTKGHLPPAIQGTFHGQGATTSGKIVHKKVGFENKKTGEHGFASHPQQEQHLWSWDHKSKKWNHIRTIYGSPNRG